MEVNAVEQREQSAFRYRRCNQVFDLKRLGKTELTQFDRAPSHLPAGKEQCLTCRLLAGAAIGCG
jgi:hypothetical protein